MTVVASAFDRKENEAYFTQPWATEALMRHVGFDGLTVWEPAAGDHRLADVLAVKAGRIITSDIMHYGRDHNLLFDFLQTDSVAPWSVDAIVTNPPYGKGNRIAFKFAQLALERCSGLVALLLPVNFDSRKTRQSLFGKSGRFAKKIVLVDRIRWFDGEGSQDGTSDHAWFVWGPAIGMAATLAYEGKQP